MRVALALVAVVGLAGCGAIRNQQVKSEMTDIGGNLKAAGQQCIAETDADKALDPIRDKVELTRPNAEAPPPFTMLSNTTYPNAQERDAIVAWGKDRSVCSSRALAISNVPAHANGFEANFLQEARGINVRASQEVDKLVVALFQGKMTYGEFAQKRYEIGRDGVEAQRQFRQAAMVADFQRQQQEEALAQQRFQNLLQAWGTYMQAVEARQPVVTTENCMRMGNTVNCTAVSR